MSESSSESSLAGAQERSHDQIVVAPLARQTIVGRLSAPSGRSSSSPDGRIPARLLAHRAVHVHHSLCSSLLYTFCQSVYPFSRSPTGNFYPDST